MQEELKQDNFVLFLYRNIRGSPLLRLPDQIVVKIMMCVELEDLLRLRHISRTFMRLFSIEPFFHQYHLTDKQSHKRLYHTHRVWSVPRSLFPSQIKAYFPDPAICDKCSQKRNGDILGKSLLSTMPLLHCSGCRSLHKSMHFSPFQRQELDDNERLCIGHEGYFPVCHHIHLNMHQVKGRANSTAGGWDKLECCSPHNHDLFPNPCGAESCPADGKPRAHCYKDEAGKLHLKVSFAAYLRVRWLANGKLCPTVLKATLILFQRMEGVGPWLKENPVIPSDPLRVFDPNFCDCVDWFDIGLGSSTRQAHFESILSPSTCTAQWREPCPPNGYQTRRGRCSQMRHGFTSKAAGMEIQIDFLRCPSKSHRLVLRKVVDVEVNPAFASTAGWGTFMNIPKSPQRDKEMDGVLHCPNKTCHVNNLQVLELDLRAEEFKKALGAQWPR